MAQETMTQSKRKSQQSKTARNADGPSPADAALEYFKEYAKERPEVVVLWAFGIGFVLGWKLKPW